MVLCVLNKIVFLSKSSKEHWLAYWCGRSVTKRMLKVEQEPQKLCNLSLKAQTHNNFILLWVSSFLMTRCTGKAFVCGTACQLTSLSDMNWPALHAWEELVGCMLMELGKKQDVSSLKELSKQTSSSIQRWPSFLQAFSSPLHALQHDYTLSLAQKPLWACLAV